MLCNDARIVPDGARWTLQGDPTEGALVVAARKLGLEESVETERHPRLDTLPFESEHQYMATLHRSGADGGRIILLKGAVERVLARCTDRMDPSGAGGPFDAEKIAGEAEAMAMDGLRVLAFASRSAPADLDGIGHGDLGSGFRFLGLQGMIDPPREEAVEAVSACRRAGLTVKMITGDHAVTAAAIARQIGILDAPADGRASPLVLTGAQAAGLTDDRLMDAAERTGVFARVAPEQKLRLVEALQAQGHVVAMTGDGVNDAPALKQADIGIAMGREGTEVAREAADMILTDDNFASIRAAVEEGRGVFDNLVKFIVWALPTNIGQGLVIIAAVFTGVPLPILPVQSLWINMTTAGSLGLMLAFEPKEAGIMDRPPRRAGEPLLSRPLVVRILTMGMVLLVSAFGLFEWEVLTGADEAAARTVAVNVFAVISMGYLLNCRSLSRSTRDVGLLTNPWILAGIGLMAALQLLLTYLPPSKPPLPHRTDRHRILGADSRGGGAVLPRRGAAEALFAARCATKGHRRYLTGRRRQDPHVRFRAGGVLSPRMAGVMFPQVRSRSRGRVRCRQGVGCGRGRPRASPSHPHREPGRAAPVPPSTVCGFRPRPKAASPAPPYLRRLSQFQPALSHAGGRRRVSRERDVPGRTEAGRGSDRGAVSAAGAPPSLVRGADHRRSGRADGPLAAYWLQRLLWAADSALAGPVDGKSGVLHHPCLVFAGTDILRAGGRTVDLPLQGRLGDKGIRRPGVDRRDVQSRARKRRADGKVLRLLQQRLARAKKTGFPAGHVSLVPIS